MSEQLYLIRISAMNTCDECDAVASAEFIVDKDFSTDTAPILETLPKLVSGILENLKSAPFTNLRPMTREEIAAWLKGEDEDDEFDDDGFGYEEEE